MNTMIIAAVIFTCTRDWAKAHVAARALPREWWVVFCVDEVDRGLVLPPVQDGEYPLGEMWARPFSRGGNLKGWSCLDGEVRVFEELFAAGADVVVKVDSDTLLFGGEALADLGGHVAAGFARTAGDGGQICGAAYALDARGCAALRAFISDRGNWRRGFAGAPEDIVFSTAWRVARLPVRRWPRAGLVFWRPGMAVPETVPCALVCRTAEDMSAAAEGGVPA